MDILLGFWHLCIATFLRKAPLTYPEEPSLKVEEDEDIFVERLLNWGLGMRIERLFLGIPGTWEMCFPGKSWHFQKWNFHLSSLIAKGSRGKVSSRRDSKATVWKWICLCICPAANKKTILKDQFGRFFVAQHIGQSNLLSKFFSFLFYLCSATQTISKIHRLKVLSSLLFFWEGWYLRPLSHL